MTARECITPGAGGPSSPRTPFQTFLALQKYGKGVNDCVCAYEEVGNLLTGALAADNPEPLIRQALYRFNSITSTLSDWDQQSAAIEDEVEAMLAQGKTPVAFLDEGQRALLANELRAVLEAAEDAEGRDDATPLLNAGTRLSALLQASYPDNQMPPADSPLSEREEDTAPAGDPAEFSRYTEDEYIRTLEKLGEIFAGIEALHGEASTASNCTRGRHIDSMRFLAQLGGYITDHVGGDCGYYGDVHTWLEIPKGVEHG